MGSKTIERTFKSSFLQRVTLVASPVNYAIMLHNPYVAGGTSVPVLSLFGPTDPYEWAPIGEKNRFVISEDRTMNSLSVGAVTAVALELLENA